MAEIIIGFIKNVKSYNYAIDAIEECIPKLLEAFSEIDSQLVDDGQVLTDAIDSYVTMMGEGYSLAQAKIDLGLDTLGEEPDYEVPTLPAHVYVKFPAFDLAIDLRQIGEDFITMFNAASRKINAAFESLGFITVLANKFDELLNAIAIPFTNNLTFMKSTEVATGQQPQGEWIIDMWFDYVKNETTDVWQVVAVGSDFTPEMNISIEILWKAIVYWKIFRIIYNVAKKTGLLDLAKKFAGKVMKLPAAMFNRYSINKRLRKTAALTTVQVALAVKPEIQVLDDEIEVIDGIVDSILTESGVIKVDIDALNKWFSKSAIGYG